MTVPPSVLTALLLIDIGKTFDRPVGVTGQLATAASLIGAIVAMLMGAWSVRFNHKSTIIDRAVALQHLHCMVCYCSEFPHDAHIFIL